ECTQISWQVAERGRHERVGGEGEKRKAVGEGNGAEGPEPWTALKRLFGSAHDMKREIGIEGAICRERLPREQFMEAAQNERGGDGGTCTGSWRERSQLRNQSGTVLTAAPRQNRDRAAQRQNQYDDARRSGSDCRREIIVDDGNKQHGEDD